MSLTKLIIASLLLCTSALAQTTAPTSPQVIPDWFMDPETHLRVLHLMRIPNDRSGVIYFTYPCITADSSLALIDTQFDDKWRQLYSFNFNTQTLAPLVTDRLTQDQVLAPKSGHLYYLADKAAWVIDIKGGTPRKIADLPAKWVPGAGFSVNADESLLLGASADVDDPAIGSSQKLSQHLPNVLFTISISTGELKVIHRINTWLGHMQFSPTDPDLLMFCHEGNWEQVDRIWLMHLSKGEPELAYKRTEPREIAGHEFWAPDGKMIWFQQNFRDLHKEFLTGKNLATGQLTQYPIPKNGVSIHYTLSPDNTFFIGDGGGKQPTGPEKYLSLLVPEGDHLKLTHLVSLQENDYTVEPNPHVSPDNRWVIFTATLFGTPQAYAVEVPPSLLPQMKTNERR